MDVEDVLLGNSEYSVRIMGLIGFLLMTKSGGQFALASPTTNSGGLVPPVIRAHVWALSAQQRD